MRPKQLSRMGTFYMREAILEVLLDHYWEGCPGLGGAEISRRTGTYRDQPMNDAIVTGYLFEMEGRQVERKDQENGKGGWRLTEAEYELRREDV